MHERDNETEAREQLKNRLEDLARFNQLSEDYEEDADYGQTPDEATLDELGFPEQYGLSLEVESVSPRWGTKTYAYVISTGSPHEEFHITVDSTGEYSPRILFVSLPWFDRVEIKLDYGTQTEIVERFCERFLYLEGPTDVELAGSEVDA